MYDALYAVPRRTRFTVRRCVPIDTTKAPTNRIFTLLLSRLAQSFRLMVGVHHYPTYLLHMQQQHPSITPLTEKEFHRHCLEARFPSKAGKLGKCPC